MGSKGAEAATARRARRLGRQVFEGRVGGEEKRVATADGAKYPRQQREARWDEGDEGDEGLT
jgi:hypothetical protein